MIYVKIFAHVHMLDHHSVPVIYSFVKKSTELAAWSGTGAGATRSTRNAGASQRPRWALQWGGAWWAAGAAPLPVTTARRQAPLSGRKGLDRLTPWATHLT